MPFNVVARVKNMTRETKLGLVVSCSFLGLLGVVLGLKMTERPEAEQGAEVAAADPNETAPAAAVPAVVTETGPHEPASLPFIDSKVLPAGGAVSPEVPPGKKDGKPSSPATAEPTVPPLPPIKIPAAPVVATVPPPLPSAPKATAPYGLWDAVLQAARTKKSAPAGSGDGKGGPKQQAGTGGAGPPLPPVRSAPSDPPLPPVPAPDGPKVADLPPPPPERKPAKVSGGKDGDPMTVAALGKAGDVTGGTKGGTAGGTLPPPPPPPPLPDLPPVGGAGNTGGAAPPPLVPIPAAPSDSSGKGSWLVPTSRLAAQGKKEGIVASPPDLPPPGGAVPAKPRDSVPTINVQGIEVGGTGGKPIKVDVLPPAGPRPAPGPDPIVVGVRPSASVPPLSIPPAPAVRVVQPDVVSYTEESYVAGSGDSFQTISNSKYGTDAYAQALYLFNRSHPLAEDDLLQSDTLKPKQTVYVPPAQILESRYASAINDVKSPVKSGVTVGTTSQRADTFPAARGSYRVAAGGEKVYDIARNLLGDGNRWVEIQKLNPGWNWELPLPAGTALQMPADARLPQ